MEGIGTQTGHWSNKAPSPSNDKTYIGRKLSSTLIIYIVRGILSTGWSCEELANRPCFSTLYSTRNK